MLSNAAAGLEEPVDALLVNSPPPIRLKDAQRVASACYPGYAQCAPLSGERDMNFRISRADGESLTLKFINGAESLDERACRSRCSSTWKRAGAAWTRCGRRITSQPTRLG